MIKHLTRTVNNTLSHSNSHSNLGLVVEVNIILIPKSEKDSTHKTTKEKNSVIRT